MVSASSRNTASGFDVTRRFSCNPAYVGHFKCNIHRLADYPNLWGYIKIFCQIPGIATTVDIDYIKAHYYGSHTHINPTGVIPRGPELDYSTPHGKAFPTTTKRHLVASPDGRNESLLINQDATLERAAARSNNGRRGALV
jgi:hypothetical protein